LVSQKPQRTFGFHFARTAAAPKLSGRKGRDPAEQFSMDRVLQRDKYRGRNPAGSQ
jgi:hypothetical protein